jgi:F-type H+-transporting ATPase subunit gamma
MATRKEVQSRIASIKNVHKITRAMEMVAAARLRRAEQRIEALRPYSEQLRKMTRQVAEAAGKTSSLALLEERPNPKQVGILLVTGDRGLAGSFNSQIIRAGVERKRELAGEGPEVVYSVVGRRGASSMRFRGENVAHDYVGFTDRPSFADAREVASQLTTEYADGELDRVELIFNRYVSPLQQYVWRQTLLPIQEAAVLGKGAEEEDAEEHEDSEIEKAHRRSSWEYEPEPEDLLAELIPEYANLSVYRALLESTASEHGSRMTAMRSASENANDLITDLTLEMNRVRQAEITQEILEVVGGAEASAN